MGLLSNLFGTKKRQPKDYLSRKAIGLGKDDWLTYRDLVTGALSTGQPGSGKTEHIFRAWVEMACDIPEASCVLLLPKSEDKSRILDWIDRSGCKKKVAEIGPESPTQFNDLAWMGSKPALNNAMAMAGALREIADTTGRAGGEALVAGQKFWANNEERFSVNIIDALRMAWGLVTRSDMMKFLEGAAKDRNAAAVLFDSPPTPEVGRSAEWQAQVKKAREHSGLWKTFEQIKSNSLSANDARDFEDVIRPFWESEYPSMAFETRSGVEAGVMAALSPMSRGIARSIMCEGCDWVPDLLDTEPHFLLVNASPLIYGRLGIAIGTAVKHAVQLWAQQRKVHSDTPLMFLLQDEGQLWCTPRDRGFAAETQRSARIAQLFATQNKANVDYAMGGGPQGEAAANSFLGTLCLKIHTHSQDMQLGEWCSFNIGKSWQNIPGWTISSNPMQQQMQQFGGYGMPMMSPSYTESMRREYILDPMAFARLQRGGPPDWQCEAIVAGKEFSNGEYWTRVFFPGGPS